MRVLPNELSPNTYRLRQDAFIPPFCPNFRCPYHSPHLEDRSSPFYWKIGWLYTGRAPYVNRRYRCKHCQSKFCYSYFFHFYRTRLGSSDQSIFELHDTGASLRKIGRLINRSEHHVRQRKKKLADWGRNQHLKLIENKKIQGPLVYDGLETFSKSQYDPCHINHMITKESLFVIYFGYAPLNRKGAMTPEQRLKLLKMERYPKNAVYRNTTSVHREVLRRVKENTKLVVHTDDHPSYKKSVKRTNRSKNNKIVHLVTPSRDHRGRNNHLFAVNHMDLLCRQQSAPMRRETIAFAKKPTALLDAYTLLMVRKNYMRPCFIKKQVRDPTAHTHTPAMKEGICKKKFTFKDFYGGVRVPDTHLRVPREWQAFKAEKVLYRKNAA
jgi:hypothetical protein